MKITVGVTSQTLDTLLTPEQKVRIVKLKDDKKFSLAFQVVGTENVYMESLGYDATIAEGFNVTSLPISIAESQLGEISLISDTADTDVRILAA